MPVGKGYSSCWKREEKKRMRYWRRVRRGKEKRVGGFSAVSVPFKRERNGNLESVSLGEQRKRGGIGEGCVSLLEGKLPLQEVC